eukprot:323210-Pelagomonas_calceolata.AAC.1
MWVGRPRIERTKTASGWLWCQAEEPVLLGCGFGAAVIAALSCIDDMSLFEDSKEITVRLDSVQQLFALFEFEDDVMLCAAYVNPEAFEKERQEQPADPQANNVNIENLANQGFDGNLQDNLQTSWLSANG